MIFRRIHGRIVPIRGDEKKGMGNGKKAAIAAAGIVATPLADTAVVTTAHRFMNMATPKSARGEASMEHVYEMAKKFSKQLAKGGNPGIGNSTSGLTMYAPHLNSIYLGNKHVPYFLHELGHAHQYQTLDKSMFRRFAITRSATASRASMLYETNLLGKAYHYAAGRAKDVVGHVLAVPNEVNAWKRAYNFAKEVGGKKLGRSVIKSAIPAVATYVTRAASQAALLGFAGATAYYGAKALLAKRSEK